MNVWQLITSASKLPIQAGTNLWDHLNNLGSSSSEGSGTPLFLQTISMSESVRDEITVSHNPHEITIVNYSDSVSIEETDILKGEV